MDCTKGTEAGMRRKNTVFWLCLVLAVTAALCACNRSFSFFGSSEPLALTGFAFDTTYTLTLYRGGSRELLDSCVSECSRYEEIFSRTRKESELYQINEIERLYARVWREETGKKNIAGAWDRFRQKKLLSGETARWEKALREKMQKEHIEEKEFSICSDGSIRIEVSREMAALVQKGLAYSELSRGGFDITIYPVSALWDFTSESPQLPDSGKVEQAVGYIGYKGLTAEGQSIRFSMPGMGIDLGGIAKGYIADRLKEYLAEGGVTSGMVNLGGNILCIGRKSAKEPFHIGIQQPFADRDETIAAINAEDVSVVSSGIYERYIWKKGKRYHHILNPRTGFPYENGLIGVTIVSSQSVDGDGLSTTAFSLGLEEGMQLINSMEGVEGVFITEDETLYYSDGFQEMLFE